MSSLYFGDSSSPILPTVKDLNKLTKMEGVTQVTMHFTPQEPKHIDWSKITPHLPRKWGKVGKPFPIPSGALFIVSQDVPYVGKRFTILQYHDLTDKIVGFEPDGNQVSYGTNAQARAEIVKHAARVNAEHGALQNDPLRFYEGNDGEPTDRRQDQAVNDA